MAPSGRTRGRAPGAPTRGHGPAGAPGAPTRGPRATDRPDPALRFARTCYDHLAGTLGVALTDVLRDRGFLAGDTLALTAAGETWLAMLGIDAPALRRQRRPLTRACLDWTERRDHLAGAVGAALAGTFLERGWLARLEGTRALRFTAHGREALYRLLALELPLA